MAFEKVQYPIKDAARDIKLSELLEQRGLPNSIKGFTEVDSYDNDIRIRLLHPGIESKRQNILLNFFTHHLIDPSF